MKFSRKKALLAVAGVVAIVAVVALPAGATSSVWLKGGEPLNEKVEFPLTGSEFVEIGSSVLLCNNTASMTTEGGSSAEITSFEVTKASCFGLSGGFKGCEATAVSASGLPWGMTVNTVDLTAEGFAVTYSFNEACSIHKVEVSFPELTVTPEKQSEIRFFRFKGEGSAIVDGSKSSIVDTTTLNLPEEDFDIYGIG
jgi:hypothetical protein